MLIKEGVNIQGLDLRVRPALIEAERIWKQFGRDEGVTITSGLDGTHSAGSLHYYGLAIDCRTRYFSSEQVIEVAAELRRSLPDQFDVIQHKTHIHIEFDPFKRLV